jgi:PEP-CTERM motif
MNRIANLSFRAVLFAAGLGALAAVAAPASAQTASFRVIGGSAGVAGPCQTFDATSPNALVAVGGCLSDPLASVRGSASASNGQLGAESRANTNVNGQFARWQTTAQFSDFVTFSSSDPNATSAIVSANLLFAGLFTVPVDGVATQSRLEGGGLIGGRQFSFLVQPNLANTDIQLSGLSLEGGTLIDSSGLSFALLRTTPIEVALNIPIDFRLTLQNFALAVNAGANTVTDFASAAIATRGLRSVSFAATADGGFGTLNGNGVGLPIGFDAFQLPNGVTANAGTWLINNRRVDPNIAAVPEPASWALMIAGFGLVGGVLRRSGRRILAASET